MLVDVHRGGFRYQLAKVLFERGEVVSHAP